MEQNNMETTPKHPLRKYIVTNHASNDLSIEVRNMETLFKALDIFKNEYKQNHAHLSVLESNNGGLTYNVLVAEVVIPLTCTVEPFVVGF